MPDVQQALLQVGQVFTPGSPVNERDLFSGRLEQFQQVIETVSQRGYHAVMYGERGVGKTSLANIISVALEGTNSNWLIPRVTCDASDDFATLWRKAFQDIVLTRGRPGLGFTAEDEIEPTAFVDRLPEVLTPDIVRRTLSDLSKGLTLLVIFDEFDRLQNKAATIAMSDTIKALSDYGVPVTILLIGVADSVDELIEGHGSIERVLVQIPMPRMSRKEIREIIDNGVKRLEMSVSINAADEIVSLSQGIPYITHLLALNSSRAALHGNSWKIEQPQVDAGMKKALDQWQQSIKNAYYDATKSQQPGNIFKEVLLACALADVDDLGFFTAAAVRSPLRIITEKNYDIPNFARHLKELSEESRGGMLQRVGESRRIRYRFTSPIMRPYIVMRAFADALLSKEQMREIDIISTELK